MEQTGSATPTRRFIGMFRSVWPGLSVGVLLTLGWGLILLPVPLLFKRIIDDRLPQKDMAGLAWDGCLVLGLYVAHLLLLVASKYMVLKNSKRVIMNLRSDVILKLQQLSISFYDSEDLGALHARVIQDTEKVDIMANFLVSVLLVSILQGVGAIALLMHMHWQLTVLLLVVAVGFWILQEAFKSRIKVRYKAWRDEFDSFSSKVQGLLQSIRLVRAYATEDREAAAMTDTASLLSDRGVEMVTLFALFHGLVELLTGVSMVVVLFGGGYFVMQGTMTLGVLVAFFTMLGYVFKPLNAILTNIDQLFGGQVALGQVYALLDHPEVEPDRLQGVEKPVVGRVEFRNVDFAYRGGQPALRHASVSVAPGQTIALVGASGAGKSTFVSLLLGFYRPQSGEVLVDDVAFADYQTKSLRSQMAVVAQDNIILAGTVRSNILYGRIDATEAELVVACEMAYAWDFIKLLPKGLDTEVGERGVKLSGGQKQRLGLARALLRDPKILILDEATSALDTVSERAVQQALEKLIGSRTTFIIAHRLSTVKNADLILVFDQGRIVERGTHDELLAQKGAYAHLFGAQWQVA